MADREQDLTRIADALVAAGKALEAFTPGAIEARKKAGGSPVTEADHAVNEVLLALLPRGDEGWLSEETADSPERLSKWRVWVVDPLDGTKEFVEGLPEWCVSIGLVEHGQPVAGGILNPATGETLLGSLETGVTLNGKPVSVSDRPSLAGARVMASRSEVRRGEWQIFDGAGFDIEPLGSVAFKLALVAAGKIDASWTLVPKNEWDVAAGTALVRAAGGVVRLPSGEEPRFNRADTLYPGLITCPRQLWDPIAEVIRLRASGA
ncbi:MAG TPA: 3'(2'),5'-bisphosphate nucleotidase CysQ [Thermoanaerobaculia bacterium]|nr:3'(2'),5'-bisphosphate nucleotidase CysQ [Thermoanaerobaculia bacterium]